jgi:hypothetical protein
MERKNINPISKDIQFLESFYGSHSAVARALGISTRNYRRIRNDGTGAAATKQAISTHAHLIRVTERRTGSERRKEQRRKS